jgi:hypothetical protein
MTQTQLNTLRTYASIMLLSPPCTKIQLPKTLYITYNSVNAQTPKPQTYTVTYLPRISDSLHPSMCSTVNLQGLIRLQKKHK